MGESLRRLRRLQEKCCGCCCCCLLPLPSLRVGVATKAAGAVAAATGWLRISSRECWGVVTLNVSWSWGSAGDVSGEDSVVASGSSGLLRESFLAEVLRRRSRSFMVAGAGLWNLNRRLFPRHTQESPRQTYPATLRKKGTDSLSE